MATSTSSHTSDDPRSESSTAAWGKVLAVIAGLAVVVSLMVLAFLAPSINSGPNDLPIALSGPPQATGPIQEQLAAKQPGAFEFTTHDTAADVTEAVRDRDAVGGISIADDQSVAITIAGGAGTPYASLMRGLGGGIEASGKKVTYNDIAPLTLDDPNGSGLGALALPLAFGGLISAVLLSTLLKDRRVHRVVGSLLASLAVGFVVVAILQFGFKSVDGNYVLTALALALGTAAISLFVLGMEARFGYAGLGIGGVVMMFIGNPLSGMATGWQWLPQPWGYIGQLLPIGATGTLIRSTAFFDGHGVSMPIIVLLCWVAVGILLTVIVSVKKQLAARTA